MEDIVVCVYNVTLVKRKGMIPFSGLSRSSGLFDGDGPSPLNRDTTVFWYLHSPQLLEVTSDLKKNSIL